MIDEYFIEGKDKPKKTGRSSYKGVNELQMSASKGTQIRKRDKIKYQRALELEGKIPDEVWERRFGYLFD